MTLVDTEEKRRTFEKSLRNEWPEADMERLPSGSYRNTGTRERWEGFLAGWWAGFEEGREDAFDAMRGME